MLFRGIYYSAKSRLLCVAGRKSKEVHSEWSVYKECIKVLYRSLTIFFSHFAEWFDSSRRLHARCVQSVLKQPLPSAWDRPHLFWVVRKDAHLFIIIFSPSLIFWAEDGKVGCLDYSTVQRLPKTDFSVKQGYYLTLNQGFLLSQVVASFSNGQSFKVICF